MQFLLNDQNRLLIIVVLCAGLWTLESVVPLYANPEDRLRRAFPNLGLTALLVAVNLLLSFVSAAAAASVTGNRSGLLFLLGDSSLLVAVLGIVALDLSTYVAHVLLHKSALGWRFHRVHHSERHVNVTTAFRFHPGETVWRIVWQVLAIVVFGIPMWVLLTYLVISAFNAQIEHANIRVNAAADRALRLVFVTPDMHKVHHSREQRETNTNYSNILSLWDKLFGTYTRRTNLQALRYGLEGFDDDSKQTFHGLLKMPFSTAR